uniref:Saposin B-type domain-containing protein n=1 Tax=Kalanchoe fedtschenkoi TaxID=63787 RepID=A0A7N0T6L0_KALFE
MASRMGLGVLMLLVLHATWTCDARPLTGSSEMLNTGLGSKDNQACPWCETYVTRAIEFLDQNKTQQDIISLLHKSCSHLRSLEGDCAALVDYYAPLFFEEVSTIHPQQFCEKVGPCELLEISSQTIDGAVKEMISKLSDPDTQASCFREEIFLEQAALSST